MKFQQYRFCKEVHEALNELGFRRPTDIQFKAIPSIMQGEDVLAIAQTGTGKTAAYAIPIVDALSRISHGGTTIRSVVMVPTRELAEQVAQVFVSLARFTDLKILGLIGGVEQESQINQLKAGVDVLVSTPGRMFDLISQGFIHLREVKTLVVDEADHMLALGFYKDIQDLLRYLPRHRQTLFFSATIDKKIKDLAYTLVNKPIRIQLSPKDPVSKNVTHSVTFVEMDDKRFFLERLIREHEDHKVLVFVRTKVRAERVFKALERVDIQSTTLHGDKTQSERTIALNQFRNGEVLVMIATDVSARGIDIEGVEYVVNYDLPEQAENYVHRVGRTGRSKHRGFAISFCSSEEMKLLQDIENYTGTVITRMNIAKNDYLDTLNFTQEQVGDWQSLLD